MSDLDPETERTTEIRTTEAGPTTTEVRRSEGRTGGNSAAWWVAGLVAVVAIIAIAFMVTQPNPNAALTDAQIAASAQQAQAQAAADAAQQSLANAQANAALNAQAANQVAQSALRGEADRAAQARADAEAAANRAARSADSSASSASATVPLAPEDAPQ